MRMIEQVDTVVVLKACDGGWTSPGHLVGGS